MVFKLFQKKGGIELRLTINSELEISMLLLSLHILIVFKKKKSHTPGNVIFERFKIITKRPAKNLDINLLTIFFIAVFLTDEFHFSAQKIEK